MRSLILLLALGFVLSAGPALVAAALAAIVR